MADKISVNSKNINKNKRNSFGMVNAILKAKD